MEILSKETKYLLRHPEFKDAVRKILSGNFEEVTIIIDEKSITLRKVTE